MKKFFLTHKAIGDAFAMRFEFVKHDRNVKYKDLHYGPHPKFHSYPASHYTDDTQMALANAEVLLSHCGYETKIQADEFIAGWLNVFQSESAPRQGYSRHMYKVMQESGSVEDFKKALDPSRGTTSGGAMRADVFGLLYNVHDVLELADYQARITHDTVAGRSAAKATALTVHFLHHGGEKNGLDDFLDYHLGADWRSEEGGYEDNPHNGLCIVLQAINAFKQSASLSEVLINSVTQAEVADTDTIASLAMSFASCCERIKHDLPQALYCDLENGAESRDYLKELDKALLKVYPSSYQYRVEPGRQSTQKPDSPSP